MSVSRTARRSDVSDLNWNRFTTRRLCPRDSLMLCRLFLPRLLYLEKHLHFSVKLLIVCGVKGFMFSSLEKERIRILLIDEEVLVRDALKALIASWGFNVGE